MAQVFNVIFNKDKIFNVTVIDKKIFNVTIKPNPYIYTLFDTDMEFTNDIDWKLATSIWTNTDVKLSMEVKYATDLYTKIDIGLIHDLEIKWYKIQHTIFESNMELDASIPCSTLLQGKVINKNIVGSEEFEFSTIRKPMFGEWINYTLYEIANMTILDMIREEINYESKGTYNEQEISISTNIVDDVEINRMTVNGIGKVDSTNYTENSIRATMVHDNGGIDSTYVMSSDGDYIPSYAVSRVFRAINEASGKVENYNYYIYASANIEDGINTQVNYEAARRTFMVEFMDKYLSELQDMTTQEMILEIKEG